MDFGPALDDCNKALKLDPSYTKAYTRRAAIEFLMKVRAHWPFPRAVVPIAVLEMLQEYHKAMDDYKRALELEPDNSDAHEGLRRTIGKIQESGGSEADNQERARHAMADPEIQAILRDPMVRLKLTHMDYCALSESCNEMTGFSMSFRTTGKCGDRRPAA